MLEFINKIMIMLYILSVLNVIKELYAFIQAWIETTPERSIKINLTPKETFLFGLSLSYVITGIITGITF